MLLGSIPLLLALGTVAFLSFDQARKQLTSAIEAKLLEKNTTYANTLNSYIEKNKMIAMALSESYAVDFPLNEVIKKEMKALSSRIPHNKDFYVGFTNRSVNDPTRFLSSTGWVPGEDYILLQRPWFKGALNQEESYLSEPYVDARTGDTIVTVSHHIKIQNEIKAVLAIDFDLVYLKNMLKEISEEDKNAEVFLLNKKGNFLFHRKYKIDENILTLANGILKKTGQDMLTQEQSFGSYVFDGIKKVYAGKKVTGTDWTLVISLPYITVFKELNNMGIFILIVGLLFTAAALFFFVFSVGRHISPIGKAVNFAQSIAQGDLKKSIDKKLLLSKDEIGKLARAMQQMSEQLKRIVYSTQESNRNVLDSSANVNNVSRTMSDAAANQAATLEEVASSLEQMKETIHNNSKSSLQTESMAKNSVNMAQESQRTVLETVSSMQKITDRISLVQDIASQTHLLSLNASIEAARAGNAGKGFSVVASEVSKLAEISSSAAKEISELAQSSMQIAQKAGDDLNRLAPEIQKTAEQVAHVATLEEDQKNAIDQINISVQELNKIAQENTMQAENLASGSESAVSQSKKLTKIISYFQL